MRKEDDYFDEIPDEKIPKDCWISPPISFNQKHPILTRKSLTIDMRTRSRSC